MENVTPFNTDQRIVSIIINDGKKYATLLEGLDIVFYGQDNDGLTGISKFHNPIFPNIGYRPKTLNPSQHHLVMDTVVDLD